MKIGDVEITPPFMNAACSVAKTMDDVKALANTKAGAVLVGSITCEPRDGNDEPRWYVGDGYALNSFGMPNKGLEFYKKQLPAMVKHVHAKDKKFVLSIAGFSTQEYVDLAKMADTTGIDVLELNLGCPNVQIDGKQKPIVSFDMTSLREIVTSVAAETRIPLILKLSPYSNPAELQRVAQTINELDDVAGVVTMNTMPNGYMHTQGKDVIATGFAGVSGPAVLPIALGQVRQLRQHLHDDIALIATGGIESAADAKLFYDVGADVVQAATLIVRDGHSALDRLA